MKILLLLQDEERLCVCDLSEILGMKIPAISQHLRKLKDGDLVQTEREGTTIFYYLTEKAKPILQVLFQFIGIEVV
jgi:DNA-binding transcriptional ArsR family regulator